MSKKRTKNQKIGEFGEDEFQRLATRNDLLATKVKKDFGIDFVCQIGSIKDSLFSSISTNFFVVNVKSSDSNRCRSLLDQDDLEGILRCDHLYLVVLWCEKSNKLYFRFVDDDFIERIHNAYFNNNKTMTLTPAVLNHISPDNTSLGDYVSQFRKGGNQNRLVTKKREMEIVRHVGPARLEIKSTSDGNYAIIILNEFENLFNADLETKSQVRDIIFSKKLTPHFFSPEIKALRNIRCALDDCVSHSLIVAPLEVGQQLDISLVKKDKVLAKCRFEHRRFGDETCFWHEAGLSLIFSAARKGNDGLYYHYFDIRCDDSESPIFECAELFEFLALIDEECELLIGASKSKMPVTQWYSLVVFGHQIRGLKIIYDHLEIALPIVTLCDLFHDEYSYDYSLLEMFFRSKELNREYLFGVSYKPEEELKWIPIKINCPVAVRIPEGNKLINFEMTGLAGVNDEESKQDIHGVKFSKYIEHWMQECPFKIEKEDSPLLLLHQGKGYNYFLDREVEVDSMEGLRFHFVEDRNEHDD